MIWKACGRKWFYQHFPRKAEENYGNLSFDRKSPGNFQI
jgi:hypothetical protein